MADKTWREVAEDAERLEREAYERGDGGSYLDYLHEKARIARGLAWRDEDAEDTENTHERSEAR